jgi:hypothetical protein
VKCSALPLRTLSSLVFGAPPRTLPWWNTRFSHRTARDSCVVRKPDNDDFHFYGFRIYRDLERKCRLDLEIADTIVRDFVEGNVFEAPMTPGQICTFVYFAAGFDLHKPEMASLASLFWRQLDWIQPESYISDGDLLLTFVSRNEDIFVAVRNALGDNPPQFLISITGRIAPDTRLRRLNDANGFEPKAAKKRRLGIEGLMKPAKEPIADVQILKAKRDELFRQFEDHPWKLSLATEIKIIDDQIAEDARGKKKAGTAQTKQ